MKEQSATGRKWHSVALFRRLKIEFEFCLPREEHREALMKASALTAPDTRFTRGSALLLDNYLNESAAQFGSFARTVLYDGKIIGFIGAQLVSADAIQPLLRARSADEYWERVLAVKYLSTNEIALLDSSHGGELLVTDFYWDTRHPRFKQGQFSKAAIERIIRWFEGLPVSAVTFSYLDKFSVISTLIFWAAGKKFARVMIEKKFFLARAQGPWTWDIGMDNFWGPRLLGRRPVTRIPITNRERWQGRVLHECAFNVEEAATILKWNVSSKPDGTRPGRMQERVRQFGIWRTSVAQSLFPPDEHQELSRQKLTLAEIRDRIRDDPSILCPEVEANVGSKQDSESRET